MGVSSDFRAGYGPTEPTKAQTIILPVAQIHNPETCQPGETSLNVQSSGSVITTQ